MLGRSEIEKRSALAFSLSLSALAGCAAGEADHALLGEREQNIIGGTQAPAGAWPTVVSIEYDFSPIQPAYCGGTLVAPTWVLTAAHCFDDIPTPEFYRVIVGRTDLDSSVGHEIPVAQIVAYPGYTQPHTHDLALLRLASPVPAGTPVTRLVSPGRMSEIRFGDDATVLGWGATSDMVDFSTTLQQVTLDVMGTGDVCNDATYYGNNAYYGSVPSNQICIGNLAGGQDACGGDSGGPAFVRRDNEWFQLGIVSWGKGCAVANTPGVYTYLPEYLEWVRSTATGSPAPSLLPSAQIVALAG